nr:uncharacterized protein LOC128701184 [Cherax quadricarinatus]
MENHPAQASTPKNRFHVSSFFNTPVASNLVNLITNAMKSRSQATAAINTTLEKQDEGSGGGDELNPATTTEENQSSNASHVGQEAFLPASPEQFGNLGTGSKFVDLLPDISEYSIETDSLAQYAGAGAMALVALGAILAVPVAPIILRRTGTSGWAGIPSWSNLLNWWSSPDPTAEAWADNYYQGYNDEYPAEAYPGGDEHYYGYDPSVSGSNVDPQVVSYHSGNTQVSGSPGKAPPAYHNTHTPTFQNNLPQSYAPNKHHPRPHRRQDNKKTQNVDGYEYVTLEQ